MRYMIESKPTVYDGVQFRSRLEARWATFFSMVRWPWMYEPVDLGEWSPDFIIDGAITLLVEVKPLLDFDNQVGGKVERGVRLWRREHPDKAAEGALLGLGPVKTDEGWPSIGWITEHYSDYDYPGSWGLCLRRALAESESRSPSRRMPQHGRLPGLHYWRLRRRGYRQFWRGFGPGSR